MQEDKLKRVVNHQNNYNTPVTFQRLINNTLREYLMILQSHTSMTFWYTQMTLRCTAVMYTRYWKAQWKDFACKEVKSKFEAKEIEFLDYIIQFGQIEKDSKNKCSQELTFTKMSQESASLSKVNKLLSKFVLIMQNCRTLTQLMHKNKRWHWDKEQKNAFHTLKKSLNGTAHLRILNSTCKRYWKLTHQILQ
jgi:hypothetical protein